MSYPLRAPSRIRGSDFFRGVARSVACLDTATRRKHTGDEERRAHFAPTRSLVQDETERCSQCSRASGNLRPAQASRPTRLAGAPGSVARANQRPRESGHRNGMQRKQDVLGEATLARPMTSQGPLGNLGMQTAGRSCEQPVSITLCSPPSSVSTLHIAGEGY